MVCPASCYTASSPQAKGRVEWVHGTHQDRLVNKLRLAGIGNYGDANYHRRRPTPRQLEEAFWLEEEHVLSEDWVVRYKNRLLQLERPSRHWAPSRNRVLVRENQSGEIAIHFRG